MKLIMLQDKIFNCYQLQKWQKCKIFLFKFKELWNVHNWGLGTETDD